MIDNEHIETRLEIRAGTPGEAIIAFVRKVGGAVSRRLFTSRNGS
jgi:hypothetical protein